MTKKYFFNQNVVNLENEKYESPVKKNKPVQVRR